VEPAVHVDDFPGAEGQQILGDGGNSLGDVFALTPPLDWRETVADKPVVFILDRLCHISGNDARPNFIDVDSVLGQA